MIDRVLAATPDQLTAVARVPDTSPVFEFHFPDFPLMPGVLLIETIAQSAGWLMVHRTGFQRLPLLGKVREAKLRGMVPPGTELVATVALVHDGSGYAVLSGTLDADGKRCLDAEVMLRILPMPNPTVQAALRHEGRRLGLPEPEPEPGQEPPA